MSASPVACDLTNGTITLGFVEPSTECDITNLTSKQSGVSITKDGSNYKAEVANSVSTLNTANLTPTVSAGAKVTYSPSGSVALNVGENTITITITAEDGTTKKTATLTVTRAEAPVTPPDEGNNGGNNNGDDKDPNEGNDQNQGGNDQDPNGGNNQGGNDQNPNEGNNQTPNNGTNQTPNNTSNTSGSGDLTNKFPYILGTCFLGADCILACIIMLVLAKKRKRR